MIDELIERIRILRHQSPAQWDFGQMYATLRDTEFELLRHKEQLKTLKELLIEIQDVK